MRHHKLREEEVEWMLVTTTLGLYLIVIFFSKGTEICRKMRIMLLRMRVMLLKCFNWLELFKLKPER